MKYLSRRNIALLAVVVTALIGAILLQTRMFAPPPPPPRVVQPTQPAIDYSAVTQILVVKTDVVRGQRLSAEHVGWHPWPNTAMPKDAIRITEFPNAINDMVNVAARQPIAANEPLIERKIVRANDRSGFLSSMLPPGWRALAVRIDPSGLNAAGNFVLPGDRVDLLVPNGGAGSRTDDMQILLRDVEILAINQAMAAPQGQTTIQGATATLKLRSTDVQKVALHQGRLILSLRPLAEPTDIATDPSPNGAAAEPTPGRTIETYRAGIIGKGRP